MLKLLFIFFSNNGKIYNNNYKLLVQTFRRRCLFCSMYAKLRKIFDLQTSVPFLMLLSSFLSIRTLWKRNVITSYHSPLPIIDTALKSNRKMNENVTKCNIYSVSKHKIHLFLKFPVGPCCVQRMVKMFCAY